MTRRRMIALGAGTVLAGPAILQGRWLTRDFKRADAAQAMPPAPEGRRLWSNWSGLQHAAPREIFAAADEAELASRIAAWDGRVRPVGSGHSFIDLVPTDGMMVDIGQLSGLIAHDPVARTATFGAGTRLRQAAMLAHEVGLAFPNLPDIDVQTLAGSFSTATHGTGRELMPLHGRVLGFRLVTPLGEIRDVTRANDPALFDAGRVALGTLGVVTQYTLQMVDSFALNRKVFIVRTAEAIDSMIERSKAHHCFEFYVLPHTGYCALITHDLFTGEVSGRAPSRDEDFIATFRTLRDVLGWWPWARRQAFEAYVRTQLNDNGLIEDETDTAWKLLSTARVTRMNECEYHIPEANAQAALREVVTAVESRPETFFPIELRFTGQDDAWLSPFNDGVRCSIAVHAAHDESLSPLFDLAEPILRRHGGRPHWGKLHSLGAADLAAIYPRFADFQAMRRQMDPGGKFLNARTARLFGEPFDA